ncbi:nucleotide sugar dehydrogenase [Microbacterium sp.]|uniref:nucleotide sugar dehydrogenase n=1 Tax=Microbacterium sp. TaxID=51671 RepID=UPI003A899241
MKEQSGRVVVVGQGYVGLPISMRANEVGFDVIGIDLDARRVSALSAGRSHVEDITDDRLRTALDTGRYAVSRDYAGAAGFDIAVVSVPTPLRETLPDLSFIESAARSLAEHVRPGATVILESTTYPGTTEELFVPILEAGSGLRAGADFAVGYSPERIDPGNTTWDLRRTPKIVSGIDEASLARVRAFFEAIVDTVVPVSSPKEAEMAKLLENTFRHVNIALVNELAVFAHQLGVNIWEAIDAASTKPFGFMKFTPGPGVGGHCLPVDPSYLSWQVRRELGQAFRFVELANDVNEHMPSYVVQRVQARLNDDAKALRGSRVLLLGLSYKRDTGDVRESPSLQVAHLLNQQGAIVAGVDSHVPEHLWPTGVEAATLDAQTLADADIAVVLVDHGDIDYSLLTQSTTPVLDTKNRLSGEHIDTL